MSDLQRRCQYYVHFGCTEQGIVGLNGSWYCVRHFKERLKEAGQQIDQLRKYMEEEEK